VVAVTVVVIVAAAMAAVVTDINQKRLPVCPNRLEGEMSGIYPGHLFLCGVRWVYNFVYFCHRVCGGYKEKYFFQTYL
jgi:hypothetical protein